MATELNDAIVAIATPPGRGAIGIVRISGSDLSAIADQLFEQEIKPRHATYCRVLNTRGETLDRAIVLYFKSPHSFTGEDVIEIQSHGGHVVTHSILQAAITATARLADPGEFSKRAFLNDKIDLIQAEAIADLIESASVRAARLAQNSLVGSFSRDVAALAERLKQVRTHLEAFIDFPDEGLTAPAFAQLTSETTQLRDELAHMLGSAARGVRLNRGIDIAIIGRPNVGKSTLLNALAGEERAIVAAEPGTTRDIMSLDLEIKGLLVRLHDTAGIHDTPIAVEREGIKRALTKLEECDLIFHVVTDPNEESSELIPDIGIPVFTLVNKIDLIALQPSVKARSSGAYLQISAKKALGLELLRDAVLEFFGLAEDADSTFLARERHVKALQQASEALVFDCADLYTNAPELGAEHLRRANASLSELLGEYTSEDLLGDIFSSFCVGK